MIDQFETFQSYNDIELVNQIAEKLQLKNIEFIIDKSKPLLDSSLVDTSFERNIHIKLRRKDFQDGHKALEDFYKTQLDDIDADYYLLSFSNDELNEIISKPDEWGYFDYQLAQKLLKDRGHEIDAKDLNELKENRIKELAQPEKASRLLIFFGYCFIPFGIIIGFFIGHHLFYSKRTLPNGQIVFSYRKSDRKHGDRIMVVAGVIFILSIIFWLIVFIREN